MGKKKREEKPPRDVLLRLKGACTPPGELAKRQVALLLMAGGQWGPEHLHFESPQRCYSHWPTDHTAWRSQLYRECSFARNANGYSILGHGSKEMMTKKNAVFQHF